MTTFALLAGAGGDASHLYSRVVPLLRARNHEALAIDLPADDEAAGLPEYADVVVQALAGRTGVVLVAHSLSGFTAPLVMERTPLRALVFLNAMVPRPGERAAEWWDNTGVSAAREAQADRGGYPREVDLETYFTHDVDPAIAAEGARRGRNETKAAFVSACDFGGWPDITMRAAAGKDDRFFPFGFQQRLARDRLGIDPDPLPGGHLLPLSQPQAFVSYLLL